MTVHMYNLTKLARIHGDSMCDVDHRDVTIELIGGGVYSYIRILHDEFLLKSILMTTDFKRNLSDRA